MMREPPEAPRTAKRVPFLANEAMRGEMEERGRERGWM